MISLRRKLPPLATLMAFEAAARLGSFTKAAAELGVTQAAISRQIHGLEESLGFPLFSRLYRRIELTEKGKLLSASTTTSFNAIAETISDISAADVDDALSISATVTFSQFWLMPKLAAFARLHPEIRLRVISQDNTLGLAGGDLAIRYGSGTWPDGRAEFLFGDELFPISSPAFASTLSRAGGIQEIVRQPLISYDSEDLLWPGWDEWLAAFSTKRPSNRVTALRTSFYTEAVFAALSGQGIALGWKRMVQTLLDTGALVRLTEESLITRSGYFVVVPAKSLQSKSAVHFVEWLRAEAARTQNEDGKTGGADLTTSV